MSSLVKMPHCFKGNLSFFVIASVIFFGSPVLADRQVGGVGYVKSLTAMPEGKIDFSIVPHHLTIEFGPARNITVDLEKVGAMARRAKEIVGDSTDPLKRIGALNQVVFKEEGYGYDFDEIGRTVKGPRLLGHLLDTKKGNCLTLPTLYLAVAQRLDWPIFPVVVPGHAFLRYVTPDGKSYNIETTDGGAIRADQDYIRDFTVPRLALEAGSYMRTLSYREFLAVWLEAAYHHYSDEGRLDEAAACLEAAVVLDPLCAQCHKNLSAVHTGLSLMRDGQQAIKHFEKAVRHDQRSKELGLVDPVETPVWISMEKRGKR